MTNRTFTALFATAAMCAAVSAMPAVAGEGRTDLKAHEHGRGAFNLAIDGTKVSVELKAPAHDIVGFEHEARTKAQKAAIAQAMAKLKGGKDIFVLPASAGCTLTSVDVDVEREGGDDHDDHGHGHKHAKKKKKKAHDHDHDHGHGKKAEEAEAVHAEFHAEYTMKCKSPGAINTIAFPYFKSFKRAEALKVNVIGPRGSKAYDVGPKAPTVSLGGLI
ncbi:MAG: DUF2796 domain-containing protein [Pseudomonadota bacterium]